MKYKALIFDFDGVLFDSERIHLKACNRVFEKLAFTIPDEEYFQNYVGLADKEMFDLILKNKSLSFSADEVVAMRRAKIHAFKAILAESESLAGVHQVKSFIEKYHQMVEHMAIYTCATREEIEATLAKLENGSLKAFFKHIVTIEDVSAGKPSPEGYLLAAKYLGVDPKDCLVIEDTQRGANAALAAGMQVAAIATTSRDKTVFRNVTFAADSYSEIDSWLSPATNPIDQ